VVKQDTEALVRAIMSTQQRLSVKLDDTNIPTDLETAVMYITVRLSKADRELIAIEEDSGCLHHGWASYMRNTWKLWEKNSPLNKYFRETFKIAHADDISGIILSVLWGRVNNNPVDPFATAAHYHKHWVQMNIDPMDEDF
jgi:hypothetical protein